MTKSNSFLLLISILILSCSHSKQEQVAASSKTPTIDSVRASTSHYFNSNFATADIDANVDVAKMSIDEIKDLMLKMHKADQQYRDSLHRGNKENEVFYWQKIKKNDDANLRLLNIITEKYSWPGITVFGKDAAETAWLVVWHHSYNRDILERYAPLIKKAEEKSGIAHGYASMAKQLALLQSIK